MFRSAMSARARRGTHCAPERPHSGTRPNVQQISLPNARVAAVEKACARTQAQPKRAPGRKHTGRWRCGQAQRAGGWGRCGRVGRCGRRQEHHAEYGGRKCAECMRWKNYWSKCQRMCARKCPSRSTDCICNASTWYFSEPHENVALGALVSARTHWQNDQHFAENTHSHRKRPSSPESNQACPSAARAARRLPGQGPDPRAAKKPGPAPSLGRAGPGRLRSERRSAARHAPHGAPRTARSAWHAPCSAPPHNPRGIRSGGRAG